MKIIDKIINRINIDNEIIYHKFHVLPDEDVSVPVILGRDLLYQLNAVLCKLKTIYCKSELIKINKTKFVNDIDFILKCAIS